MKNIKLKSINKISVTKQTLTKMVLATTVMLSMQACATTNFDPSWNNSDSNNQNVVKNPSNTNGTGAKVSKLIIRSNVPMPEVTVSNQQYRPTKMIPVSLYGSQKVDISEIDNFLNQASPSARHYPPNFPNRTQRYNTRIYLKKYVNWMQQYADRPDASYDILIRAAQLNGMARNLDMGSDYAVRGQKYVDRALKINPNDVEANLLYGFMLTEGGAFETGQKYLDKAIELGSIEAEQSLAQTHLINDKRFEALSRLQKLQWGNPNNTQISQQLAIVNSGKYYIWDLPANNINLKSLP